jgi:uncharacterized protein (TIGR02646 family)
MIRVPRDRPDPGGIPIQPAAAWSANATAATALAIGDGPGHVVTDLYRADHVKVALEALFDQKCAYCEQTGVGVFDWDVEHFRPKGRVAEDTTHPGYYWLAYTWENLFPSCPTCNQRRKDKATYADPTVGLSLGKLDQFPLEPGSPRVDAPGVDLTTERPAILNPCVDEPLDHLDLVPDGTLRSRPGSSKGPKSISVFGLNRKRSRNGRHLALLNIRRLVDIQINKNTDPNTALTVALDAMSYPDTPYSFVAHAVRRDPTAFGF